MAISGSLMKGIQLRPVLVFVAGTCTDKISAQSLASNNAPLGTVLKAFMVCTPDEAKSSTTP